MTLSRREVILLTAVFCMLVVVWYVMMFFLPIREEMAHLRRTIESHREEILPARNRTTIKYPMLSYHLNQLDYKWQETMEGIPKTFDNTEIFRLLQNLIYHYVPTLDIQISPSSTEMPDGLNVTGVRASFSSDKYGIESLLDDIWQDGSETRIINYSVSPIGSDGQMNVTLYIEFLTIGHM